MLFRLLLVLSVLLAPAEGAPIFIRNPRSHEQIRIKEENVTAPPKTSEDTVYKIVIPAAILFVLAVFIRPIAIIYCCLKKKRPMKVAESQNCADDCRECNTKLNGEFDIFCTSGDITMLHKASIVEVKESKINPDLDDYIQTHPSILKGRNPIKNKSKGKNVSFQESDDQYVYIYDSESSQPGRQMRYFRNKEGYRKKKNPAGHNSTTTPLLGGYHVRIRQPVMKQNRHRFQDWSLHSPMDMTLTRVSAVRHVHGQVTYLLHNDVDSRIGLYSHPWMCHLLDFPQSGCSRTSELPAA